MLKSIYLAIAGWVRSMVNKKVDLRYAGAEQIREVNQQPGRNSLQMNALHL